MNCDNKGGRVFLIMFKTGHALLLPGGRILRPRMRREADAGQPLDSRVSRPRQWLFRDLKSATVRAQPRTIRGREQSATAFRPRPQTRQRIVLSRELATASTVHE